MNGRQKEAKTKEENNMKITKSQLKQIILEELKEEEYWSDEKDRPWDEHIDKINKFLKDSDIFAESIKSIARKAIDLYKYETRDDAETGISAELNAIFDNYVDGMFEAGYRTRPAGILDSILDEEFPLGERGHKDPDAPVQTGSDLEDPDERLLDVD